MRLITLDFETFFSKDYNLRKLTTEAYVRGSEFEVLCCGIKNGPLIRNYNQAAILCHHAQFDGLILSHHYGVKPLFWFDTLAMARMLYPHDKSHSLDSLAKKFNLPAKIVPYKEFEGKRLKDLSPETLHRLKEGCQHDVELTHDIFCNLIRGFPRDELRVIDLTIRMFTEPVLQLDRDRAKAYLEKTVAAQEDLLNRLGVDKSSLASSNKFAALLEQYGVEPPTKISPRTGKEVFAFAKTDQGFLELVNHEYEDIRLLAEARLATKSTIGETRASRLLNMSERGALPVYLKYYGAHTGRWSGGDKLNFQNFPRGGELRKSLLAPEGKVLCVADHAQIECRVLNWLAGEKWVLDAFRTGRDLYSEMASSFYGREINKKDHPKERVLGKTLVLGAGYGIGWKKLQGVLKLGGVDLDEGLARRAIDTYRGKHPNVVELWKKADYIIEQMCGNKNFGFTWGKNFGFTWGPMEVYGNKIVLPNDAEMDYSSLRINHEGYYLDLPRGKTKIYGGKLVENVVQALARVVMSEAMIKIAERYKIVLTCHDELVYLANHDEADKALEFGLSVMKSAPWWAKDLPLDAEGGWDVRYSK